MLPPLGELLDRYGLEPEVSSRTSCKGTRYCRSQHPHDLTRCASCSCKPLGDQSDNMLQQMSYPAYHSRFLSLCPPLAVRSRSTCTARCWPTWRRPPQPRPPRRARSRSAARPRLKVALVIVSYPQCVSCRDLPLLTCSRYP